MPLMFGFAFWAACTSVRGEHEQVIDTAPVNTATVGAEAGIPTQTPILTIHNSDSAEQAAASEGQLVIGQMAPDFEMRSATGETFRLSQILGQRPIVISQSCCTDNSAEEYKTASVIKATFGESIEVVGISNAENPSPVDGINVLNLDSASPDFESKYPTHQDPLTIYIDQDGIVVATKQTEPEEYVVKALLEAGLPKDTSREHFMPFDLDPRFEQGSSFKSKVDLLIHDINALSGELSSVAVDRRDRQLYDQTREAISTDLLEKAIRYELDVAMFAARGDRDQQIEYTQRYVSLLLVKGRQFLGLYCRTDDQRILPLIKGLGSLAYLEFQKHFEKNAWELEGAYRHFDYVAGCQSPYNN